MKVEGGRRVGGRGAGSFGILHPLSCLGIPLLIVAVYIVMVLLLPAEGLARATREGGPVEMPSALAYFAAVPMLLWLSRDDRSFFLSAALLMTLLGGRELEFHEAFTTDSVLKLSYYVRDHVPVMEKLASAAVLAVVAAVLLRFVLRNGRRLLRGVIERRAPAWSIAVAVALLPVTKLVLDTGPRVLRDDLSLALPANARMAFGAFEEMIELAIPLLFLWAIAQYALLRRDRAR